MGNYDYEAAKKLIYDESNVTETNPLRDLFQICVKLIIILVVIYFGIFFSSGIIISNLSPEQQRKLENMLSDSVLNRYEFIETPADAEILNEIKNRIINLDKKYPKTSSLNIHVIKNSVPNAFCYPNGNIYITSALYNKLTDKEMLTFVIAHEMAHYKYKDHLMQLRKNISTASVILFISITSPDNKSTSSMIESAIDITDLKYSRKTEAKADRYASEVLTYLYGNVSGGIRALTVIDKESMHIPELLSTHPDTKKRIKTLKAFRLIKK